MHGPHATSQLCGPHESFIILESTQSFDQYEPVSTLRSSPGQEAKIFYWNPEIQFGPTVPEDLEATGGLKPGKK